MAEFVERLADVVHRPVAAGLLRSGREGLRPPATGKFLHRRHVDRAVVKKLLDLGKMGSQEATVGADRVAAQWNGSGSGMCSWGQRLGTRLLKAHSGCADRLEQPGTGVHVGDEVVHPASSAADACTVRSGPSAINSRLSSVSSIAISTIT